MRLLIVCVFTVLPSATAALVISLLKFLVLAVLLVSTTVLCCAWLSCERYITCCWTSCCHCHRRCLFRNCHRGVADDCCGGGGWWLLL
ncbi:hypothetical protein PR002_g7317 [Phytophthora rubi]|uniref:Uncharacterized protein n=1 Tax=Phytophthora rubi TaxID=129364 RepID=A0A6A3MSB1_9STRA|nr:hypothetical protein PR002_g7317 [Phytophthora rubi]